MKKIKLLCIVFWAFHLIAQDQNFSNPKAHLLLISPSLAGSEANVSVQSNFRNQWQTIGQPFKSQVFSIDANLNNNLRKNKSIFSIGLIVARQLSSDLILTRTDVLLSSSCKILLNKENRLSLGLNFGNIQTSIDASYGQWASQYDSGNFNSNLNNGENQIINQFARFDVGAGLNYEYRSYDNTSALKKATLAFGAFHLNQPNISLNSTLDELYVRYNAFFNFEFASGQNRIQPHLLLMKQGPNWQANLGTDFTIPLSEASQFTNYKKASSMSFGIATRIMDAFIFKYQLQYQYYSIFVIYDMTISNLNEAKGIQNAFELGLQFKWKKRRFF